MSQARYLAIMVSLYFGFAVLVACCLALVASFTIIPMYQNYRDHGSIFLAPTPLDHLNQHRGRI